MFSLGSQGRGNILLRQVSAAVGMIAACALGGCGNDNGPTPPNPPLTVQEILEICSSYNDPAGEHYLDFTPPKKVELNDLTGKSDTKTGTYAIDEKTHTVFVQFEGSRVSYVAFAPPGFFGCLLISGSAGAANLNASWFGDVDPPDSN